MAEKTKIEWTDATWNPWLGCTRISPGCDNCYAAVSAPARTRHVIWGAKEARQETGPKNWNLPKTWNRAAPAFLAEHGRRRRVFCASLADVFDNAVDQALRLRALHLMAECTEIDWLVLTKRVGNVAGMVPLTWMATGGWPAHIRIGATIVNQEEADRDIPKLLDLPAPNFLSMEPLLGPVDLDKNLGGTRWIAAQRGCGGATNGRHHHDDLCGHGIDWVIVGGESGNGARPMHPDWARSLREQCAGAYVPFLFKQWGSWTVHEVDVEGGVEPGMPMTFKGLLHWTGIAWESPADDAMAGDVIRPGATLAMPADKKVAGRLLDGRTHDGYPKAT
jgi:protein gp37